MNQKEYPLVTIVTVTFNLLKSNREKYFRQNLESVHNQTYKNIEHIIIDGASDDGTVELIREYADKGWVKYISEPDTGIYDAMNKGVKMAEGKYIAFLNSDDYYHGNFGVEASVKALEESGADFSYAPVVIMNEDGTKNNKHPYCSPKISTMFYFMAFCHQTMFTKKSVLISEGMFDTSFNSAGDYDFILRLCLKNYKNIFVKDVFATFRIGGFTKTSRDLSIKEAADVYLKNYNKLCPITRKECGKIFCNGYENIPLKLAEKLKIFDSYFNFEEYLQNTKNSRLLKRKIKKCCEYITNGRLRQPARKIWYGIRGKKLK